MNENVILVVDYEKICRLCLQTTGAMSDLFDNNMGNTLKDLVHRATGLEVERLDGFPDKICYRCRYIVELNCELRDMVSQTNALLLNAGNLQTGDEQELIPAAHKPVETVVNKLNINKESPDLRLVMQDGVMMLTASVEPSVTPRDEKPENSNDATDYREIKLEDTQNNKIIIPGRACQAPPKQLTCQICLSSFYNVEDVTSHVHTHYAGSGLTPYTKLKCPFNCEVCRSVVSKTELIQHHRSHLNVNPFKCKHAGCSYVGKNQDALRRHITCHSARTLVCEVCGARFKRRPSLLQHYARAHRPAPAYCRACRKRFRNCVTLRAHLLTCHRPSRYKCTWPECGKAYHSPYALTVHSRAHTDDRAFRCQLCDHAAYTSQSQLNRHLRMHARSRMSKCDQCAATFDDYGAFYKHRITEHGKWLRYKCNGCFKRYQTEPKLIEHMGTCERALAQPARDTTQDSLQARNNGDSQLIEGQRGGNDLLDKFKGPALLVQPGNAGNLAGEIELPDIPPGGLLYIEVDDDDNENNAWQH